MPATPDVLPRRRTVRLAGYDYSQPGAYFVTACAHDRRCLFGKVAGDSVHLTSAGHVLQNCWPLVAERFSDVEIDTSIVMPNHVHFIVLLALAREAATERRPTLAQVVAFFKYQGAKRINELWHTPGATVWQRGYYEHVIRSEAALLRIREYIATNPVRWDLDELNPDRVGGRGDRDGHGFGRGDRAPTHSVQ